MCISRRSTMYIDKLLIIGILHGNAQQFAIPNAVLRLYFAGETFLSCKLKTP